MKFLLIALIALFGALSTSAYAVTAEECLDTIYQALDDFYAQPGLADERSRRCSKDWDRVSSLTSHFCEGTVRTSTRISVAIWAPKSDFPLLCALGYQACDGTDRTFYEPLDTNGDHGQARGQVSRLCGDLLDD